MLLIDNTHSPDDLEGMTVGGQVTVIGANGVGGNVYYGRVPNGGPVIYGFGPSWGTPGASFDFPVVSYTTPPLHIVNLYGDNENNP